MVRLPRSVVLPDIFSSRLPEKFHVCYFLWQAMCAFVVVKDYSGFFTVKEQYRSVARQLLMRTVYCYIYRVEGNRMLKLGC